MSQLLLADLTSLSNESKRKSPDVKAAADLALSNLRADFEATLNKCKGANGGPNFAAGHRRRGSAASQPLKNNLTEAETNALLEENLLLKPIVLACNPKTHVKVTGLGVALLQRIVSMQVVPEEAVAPLLNLLSPLLAKGDIELQLKLLQTLSALLLSYPSIHGELLSSILNLCFRLQDSKAQVVSSTAAATVRQVVMIVFEKVVEEDKVLDGIKEGGEDAAVAAPLAASTIDVPGNDRVTLFPSSADAYHVLLDLNSLAQEDPANFLKLACLPKTFTLELIESILTNHSSLVRAHPELLYTLRRSTCPLLIRALSEKLPFSSVLRFVRLLFVLLRQFSTELVVEVEILVSILLRFMDPQSQDGDRDNTRSEARWQRIVALEVTRSLCSDGQFVRNLWQWFDGKDSSAKVFAQLIGTLHQLVIEEATSIGAQLPETVMSPSTSARPSIDRPSTGGLYEAAAGMASAVFNPSGSQKDDKAILGLASAPSIQFVDQLEKIEPPTAPSTYSLLLASQSLVHLAQSLAQYALPAYSHFVNSRPGSSKEAPPRLDLSALPPSEATSIAQCKAMVEAACKPLRLSLFALLSGRVDDAIFCEVLTAVRNWTNTCGVLGLDRSRDSFISSIASISAPPDALSALEGRDEQQHQLTERNLAACRVLVHVAVYLSGILDERWLPVLTAISQAEFLLRRAVSRRSTVAAQGNDSASYDDNISASPSKYAIAPSPFQPGFSLASSPLDSKSGRPQLLAGLDPSSVLKQIERCFENSTSLSNPAFKHFVDALCTLSELTAQQATQNEDSTDAVLTPISTPAKSQRHSKQDSESTGLLARVSKGGILPAAVVLTDMSLVLRLNVGRIVGQPASEGWQGVTTHLLSIASAKSLKVNIRAQAAEVLSELLVQATEITAGDGTLADAGDVVRTQTQVFEALRPLCIQDGRSRSEDLQIRQLGCNAVSEIIEKYGHALRLGWEVIFEIAVAACINSSDTGSTSPDATVRETPQKKQHANVASIRSTLPLLKVAFSFVQRICTDLLAALDLTQLKLCIQTVRDFSTSEDINVALTAASSFWGITAELAGRSSPDGQAGPEIVDLWMCILDAFKTTALDPRPEVRDAAISGLFRVLTSYGTILGPSAWSQALRTVVFPLLENVTTSSQQARRDSVAAAAALSSAAVTSPQKARGRRTSSSAQLQQAPPPATDKQWSETCIVAFQHAGGVISDYLVSRLVESQDFLDLWDELLAKVKTAFLSGPAPVSQAAIQAFDSIVKAEIPTSQEHAKYDDIAQAWRRGWQVWSSIADGIAAAPTAFTQANLATLVECFSSLYKCQPEAIELEAVSRLQKIMTYTQSPDVLNDVDTMTPLQSVTWRTIRDLKVVPGIPSKVISVLAERIALPFTLSEIAADGEPAGASTASTRAGQPSFVAVHKASVKEALACYEKWRDEEELYSSGAFNTLLGSLAIPMKLRYECPRPFRYAPSDKDAPMPHPLWQESMLAHCSLIRGVSQFIATSGDRLGQDVHDSLWRQLLSTTQAMFEADCSAVRGSSPSGQASDGQVQPTVPYETAMQDQAYDLVLLSTFERYLWPILGDKRTPSDAIRQFSESLGKASHLFEDRGESANGNGSLGTVVEPVPTTRETTCLACLDLLVLLCSDQGSGGGDEAQDHRVAALSVVALLQRVSRTVRQYVADAKVRGGAPFPRVRDEELFAVLSLLLDLKVKEGTLSAGLDADPSARVAELSKEAEAPVSIKTLSQRSPRAILFALHGPLCDVVALASTAPSMAGSTAGGAGAQLIDPPEVTHRIPSPPDGWQYEGRIGHENVLGSKRLDRNEARRLADLARACLEVVSEAL